MYVAECHPAGMPERIDAIVEASLVGPRCSCVICERRWTIFVEHYGVTEGRCRVIHLESASVSLRADTKGKPPRG